MGVPRNGSFIMENPIEMDDDWGYPQLWKDPNGQFKSKKKRDTKIYKGDRMGMIGEIPILFYGIL